MLTSQRKRLILDVLARDGQVVAKKLSEDLALSEDTIRRDLRELAAEGLLQRVHGGALPASPTVADLHARRGMAVEAKARLGQAAAGLIEPGQTVIFDGGTSNAEIVRHLPTDLHFTAITHSPAIAMELEHHAHVDVLLIGGKLFRHSMVAVGALAMETISRLRADLFFLGVTGVHEDEGLTTGDMEEAAIKRALIARSAETVVLATNDKLGAVSPYLVAKPNEVATLVLLKDAPVATAARLQQAGATILLT
ncbi:transcriptional regulator, DeoR family [Mesorhizobium albiziae]|uniref:Transcriptional regulator, DeoR family n=1 Tax=Neomesorhizobium albiziae TaxID=335020 RepID=A0A1I4B361_9HYPH|nr:DeoR/GlpR family DNA-binding transcription regulator [Mesorhizobium albiziae]GLS34273.1 DeoR family transcriptional regulator [Mesorhizobium albiziae]SFK62820.1 transcriptional regulator, DeoR family [Mesorhizobium albiziae]